jgi:LPXTG-site transpeptidase (sortase) family protein
MKRVEYLLWISGFLLLALYFAGRVWAESERTAGVEDFVALKHAVATSALPPRANGAAAVARVDSRASLPPNDGAARSSLIRPAGTAMAMTAPRTSGLVVARAPVVVAATAPQADTAIAILRIPRLALEVPVAIGTDARTLRRGAGLIAGSAAPGSSGNVSIAAHRDSFFRPLADVVVGDLIELESLHRTDSYRIAELTVVDPDDVHVLAQGAQSVLTLVTCYPFRFVGRAPQRFIVRALATEFHPQKPRRKT